MKRLPGMLLLFAAFFLWACGTWSDNSPTDSVLEYLPLDDSPYPYAGLPRLVIETKNFRQVLDKETKVPAYAQIYGEKAPESSIKNLTIKGRGNSSFVMSKYSYKIKFEKKESLFGMPKDKEWDLVANFRDKSMVRNYITYQLAGLLGDEYNPKCQFVELYINREYRGIFLLVEHVKVSENRVNISKGDSSFLFEQTSATSTDGVMFTSSLGYIFKYCSPKEPSSEAAELLENHIDEFEAFLKTPKVYKQENIARWIDIEDFIRYYWIQEFTKNLDGHRRSIFLTWESGDDAPIKMGPVWDFDLAFGNSRSDNSAPEQWLTRKYGWNRYLFKGSDYQSLVREYWKNNRPVFVSILDSIDSISRKLQKASRNEFKRWPVLENTYDMPFYESYGSYEEAVDTLKSWIERRIQWIDENL